MVAFQVKLYFLWTLERLVRGL